MIESVPPYPLGLSFAAPPWDSRTRSGLWRSLVEILRQVQADVPSFRSETNHKYEQILAIEAFESFDKSKDPEMGARLPSGVDIVCATKVSGNSCISPKSMRTVLFFSSTPKLLMSMSDCVNIRRSSLILTGDTWFLIWSGRFVYACPRLHVSERCLLEKIQAWMHCIQVPLQGIDARER